MNSSSGKGAQLRAALAAGPVVAPFVFDGLQARLAERAGFSTLYLTGFGTAASRGLPDLGLLGMSDMVAAVAVVAGATSLPVVADADTGYGGVLNVMRTVRAYETNGAAGLHIEDQVWPKRCGFFAGKEVIALDDMVAKVRSACDARSDADTVIIARTDALAPHGWEETERRARAYRDAGADMIFVDGIRTVDDLDEYLRRLGDLPLVYNGAAKPVAELAGTWCCPAAARRVAGVDRRSHRRCLQSAGRGSDPDDDGRLRRPARASRCQRRPRHRGFVRTGCSALSRR